MVSTPTALYVYDSNGNTTSKTDSTGTTNFTWDYENRLTSVTLPGSGGTVTFKYDPLGHRIYKSSSAGTSIFAYDEDELIEEVNASGVLVARYSQGHNIDEPLAESRSSTTSYYEQDDLGSVTSLSNGTGSLAQTYTFDSFGKQTASSGSTTNPFRYTGREFDSETGLYYYRARYYDPTMGRFFSEDPIGWAGGHNLYRYVKNQPTILTDPSGLLGAANANIDAKCLVCTVFGEGRGLDAACQYGIASVIINRLSEARKKARQPVTVCDIVSAPGQFDAYGNANYRNCMNNTCSKKDQPDLDKTWDNFSQPFQLLDGATYFGNNTAVIRNFFNKMKKKPVPNKPCSSLVFYGEP
jgi:RHS repeat-associated protein